MLKMDTKLEREEDERMVVMVAREEIRRWVDSRPTVLVTREHPSQRSYLTKL